MKRLVVKAAPEDRKKRLEPFHFGTDGNHEMLSSPRKSQPA